MVVGCVPSIVMAWERAGAAQPRGVPAVLPTASASAGSAENASSGATEPAAEGTSPSGDEAPHVLSADDLPEPRTRVRHKATGFELGLRTGYGLPIGAADGGTQMHDMITTIVPLWVDLGYRLSPQEYGGIYFQHGFGTLNTDAGRPESRCVGSGLSCTTSDVRFGIDFEFHFSPFETFDPWLGFGTGLEVETFSVSGSAGTATIRDLGIELLNVQFGVAWNINRALAVGPFVSFSFDEFKSIFTDTTGSIAVPEGNGNVADPTFHGWFLIGVRTSCDFSSR